MSYKNLSQRVLPRAFIWRRLQSLMGLWLLLFLIEHLLVNSQAALFLGENGRGFVEMVNSIHNLPYLPLIELTLLGVPIGVHLFWGLQYLRTGKSNVYPGDGSRPSLPQYARNHAYTWQRLTSWILLVGLLAHIVHFRVLHYPQGVYSDKGKVYLSKVGFDEGLYTLAARLHVSLYDEKRIQGEKETWHTLQKELFPKEEGDPSPFFEERIAQRKELLQRNREKEEFLKVLEKMPIESEEVIAVAPDFGTASLLTVREAFKHPFYGILYTVFVLAACFHAGNGLWTFLLTWGVVLKTAAQKALAKAAVGFMCVLAFLGLIAVWGTYWLNLKQ